MTVTVRIAEGTARQPFHGCDPDYIATVCHGACCRRSTGGILVTVDDDEAVGVAVAMRARGGDVIDGRVVPAPDTPNRCPAQSDRDLCSLHWSGTKPFGCIASPFTLSKGGRALIVRNRYRLLRCYRDGDTPAYRAFGASLDLILGTDEAARITRHFDGGGGDTTVVMSDETADRLRRLDDMKGATS